MSVSRCSDRPVLDNAPGAENLGLPMITSIHQDGLQIEGDDLDKLDVELARLDGYWLTCQRWCRFGPSAPISPPAVV